MRASARIGSSRRWPGRAGALTLAALLVAGAAAGAGKQLPAYCDPGLTVEPGDRLAYGRHGQEDAYCEGRYTAQVSGSSLSVAALEANGSSTPSDDSATIELAWGASAGELRVRAESLEPKTFYRMDTLVSTASFRWGTQRMKAIGVKPSKLGVVAVGQKAGRTVHVPVQVGSGGSKRPPRLVIVPSKPIDQLYLSIIEIAGDGTRLPARPVPPDRSFYIAGEPVAIDLPELARSGALFEVKIGATLTGGGQATRDLYVSVP